MDENQKFTQTTNDTLPQRKFGGTPALANLSLRLKLFASIIGVTVVSIAIFGYFAYTRAQQLQTFLTGTLQTAVQTQSEQQLNSTAHAQAQDIDQLLSEIALAVKGLADYRVKIYAQKGVLNEGEYWDARTKLSKLPAGQYVNSTSDTAAVFIPNTVPTLDDAIISDLNDSINLDFSAPGILKNHPNMAAIYYMSAYKYVVYYPNFDQSVLPPDLDATTLPWYTDVVPQNNPGRKDLWTAPYQDPAGQGLLVTNSIPVYDQNGTFRGVMAADVQLSKLTENISAVKIAKSGFAFLIDHAGHIIAMPKPGYTLFGLQPEVVPINETPKSTLVGQGPAGFQNAINQMIVGKDGLSTVKIGNVEYYVAYSPLSTIGYSLGVLVPTAEMNETFLAARGNLENETQNTLNFAAIILAILLLAAVSVSFLLSQNIIRPLAKLTQVAQAIAAGKIDLQAKVESNDEIGTLAHSFNLMTSQLRDLISDLEQRVADRTKALITSNEVSRRILIILDQKQLVNEVVDQVQGAFNYYHAHIYLLNEEGDKLIMAGGTGEAGQIMLAQNHKIALGKGLVGRAAQQNQAVLVSDVSKDPDWLPNPLLPDTKSEIAVPISIADQVIGVLDVQHNIADGLQQADVDLLESIANQVAFAIRNARSYTELQTQAKSEMLIGSIGQKILNATTLEDTIQIAARELGRALNSQETRVVLRAGKNISNKN